MGGAVLFEDALAARLNLMRPSRATVAAFLAAHPPRLTPGLRLLTHTCPWRGDGPRVRASRADPKGPSPATVTVSWLCTRRAWPQVCPSVVPTRMRAMMHMPPSRNPQLVTRGAPA